MTQTNINSLIQETTGALSTSSAVLLYLSIVLDGEQAPETLSFLGDEDAAAIHQQLEKLFATPLYDLRFPVLDELQKFIDQPEFRNLDEIEGSWLLHYLKEEKPTVIALILKHLSNDTVCRVLDNMSMDLRESLPDPDVVGEVSSEVVSTVRKGFEAHLAEFVPKKSEIDLSSIPEDGQVILKLCDLSCDSLLSVVRDLGLEVLALAFQSIHERPLIELVKNLDEEDAELLFQKFTDNNSASRAAIKNAQLEILNLSLNFSNGDDLILEAGVQRLARALVGFSEDMVTFLKHKLPLKQGYQLSRYYDDFCFRSTAEEAIRRSRAFVTLRVQDLLRRGHVNHTGVNEVSEVIPRVSATMHTFNSIANSQFSGGVRHG